MGKGGHGNGQQFKCGSSITFAFFIYTSKEERLNDFFWEQHNKRAYTEFIKIIFQHPVIITIHVQCPQPHIYTLTTHIHLHGILFSRSQNETHQTKYTNERLPMYFEMPNAHSLPNIIMIIYLFCSVSVPGSLSHFFTRF